MIPSIVVSPGGLVCWVMDADKAAAVVAALEGRWMDGDELAELLAASRRAGE